MFLTSPVHVRSVYTHFYYETLELARGCRPETFQVLVRVVRLDTHIDVRWDDPGRIEMSIPDYRGNFVLSEDLRHFDLPLRASRKADIRTPLGIVTTEPAGSLQKVTLTLDPALPIDDVRFFYYSEGRILPLTR